MTDKTNGRPQLRLISFQAQAAAFLALMFHFPHSIFLRSKINHLIPMELPSLSQLLFLLLLLISLPAASFASADEKLSAYQVLQLYNFPIGILPKGVVGYELNRETGEFSAYLNGTCTFPIESYDLSYKSTIRGVISRDRIRNLKGVSVKFLFFWLNIVEVTRDGDDMGFSVGIASANFPLDNFFECPQCGCGLNCNAHSNGFVSSI